MNIHWLDREIQHINKVIGSAFKVLINIVNHVEQLASIDQHVYWCKSTPTKLPDVLLQEERTVIGSSSLLIYKFPSEITSASTTSKSTSEINPAATTSKSTSKITPAATTTNETTPAPATTSKSTITIKSKQKDLYHNLNLNDNPFLETGIIVIKLLKLVAVLVAFTLKLEKINVDIFKKLKCLKDDFSTLIKINDTFSTENEELKRKLRASEINDIEFKHLSKKAKGKRIIIQINDDDNKDEDVDDDLMDVKSNATDELPKESNERGARVC
ncbi:hypothetical protein C1646_775743 [Rhizophagus diaphanus]|nr:hypothetical protein C1646_775743 [Rhizophagus diaphanus] [Rhizophagus sp. MUCL 43196]